MINMSGPLKVFIPNSEKLRNLIGESVTQEKVYAKLVEANGDFNTNNPVEIVKDIGKTIALAHRH